MFRPAALLLPLVLVCLCAPAQAAAQPGLDGAWAGAIEAAGQTLGIRVVFAGSATTLRAAIDIPQQGVADRTLSAVSLNDDRLHMEMGGGRVVFEGTVSGDRIEGVFVQGLVKGTFTLARGADAPAVSAAARTAASPPRGVREEEVAVTNGDVTLGGTLALPEGAGPFPAVVLLSGSGAQNRDSEVFGFPLFRELARHLAGAGFAVYRYDDRGVGKSTGLAAETTPVHVAGDALAALGVLARRPDIQRGRLGIVGHSEGAASAAIAASRSSEVAFVVLLAGPALRGDLVLRQQAADLARAQGASEEALARIAAAHRNLTEAVRSGAPLELVRSAAQALAREQLDLLPLPQRAALGDLDAYAAKAAAAVAAQLLTPAGRFLLDFDPAATLGSLKGPVLAVFGSRDTQVPPAQHEAPMRKALAGNPAAKVTVIDGANHLFQTAKTGLVTEYARLEKAFAPAMVEIVTSWLRARD
jgi:pimeloyl-ACP methyl ester carboxylesterase